jgi:acetyl esterase/lipase
MKKTISVGLTQPGLWLDSDITYAQVPALFGHITKNLKLSLVRHFEGQPESLPLIIWLCGGAWMDMDVNVHLPNFSDLARRGYVIASVGYRLSHEAKYPAQLEDILAAIDFLRQNAGRYQIDPSRIGVMGESAGGHLASMVGVSAPVQAVCAWYAPVDLDTGKRPLPPGLPPGSIGPHQLLLGMSNQPDEAALRRACPLSFLSAKTPPFLLLHGSADETVPASESELFHDRLEQNGTPVDFYRVEGAGHAALDFFQPPVQDLIGSFFDRYLKAR